MSRKVLRTKIIKTEILKTFLILCGITDTKAIYKNNIFHLAEAVVTLVTHRRRDNVANVVRTSVSLLACCS